MTSVQLLTSHHWRVPAHPFRLPTQDGVQIGGTRLGEHGAGLPAVMLSHGLMGWHRKPRFAVFAEQLSQWFAVYAIDHRGHGALGRGRATSAAPRSTTSRRWSSGHARTGTSASSRRHLHGRDRDDPSRRADRRCRRGGRDLVPGVLGSGTATPIRSPAATCITRSARPPAGPRCARWVSACPSTGTNPNRPRRSSARSPRCRSDHPRHATTSCSAPSHAQRLFDAAGEPKRLLLGEGFGHAEDGLSPRSRTRLVSVVHEAVGWHGPGEAVRRPARAGRRLRVEATGRTVGEVVDQLSERYGERFARSRPWGPTS